MSRKVHVVDWRAVNWLEGTRGLGWDETATYITALNLMYARDGRCPNDPHFIATHIATPGRRRQSVAGSTKRAAHAIARLVELGKLQVSDDGLHLTNGRADVELGVAGKRIDNATRAGFASGMARRTRAIATARSMRRDDHSTTTQRPLNAHSTGSQMSENKDLTRTGVRTTTIMSNRDNLTDAARDPALVGKAPGRAHAKHEPEAKPKPPSRTTERVAALAAERRAKLANGQHEVAAASAPSTARIKGDVRLADAAAKARAKLMGGGNA